MRLWPCVGWARWLFQDAQIALFLHFLTLFGFVTRPQETVVLRLRWSIIELGNFNGRNLGIGRSFESRWAVVQRRIIRQIEEIDDKLDSIWVVVGQVYVGCVALLHKVGSASSLVNVLLRTCLLFTHLHVHLEAGLEVFRAGAHDRFVYTIRIVTAGDRHVGVVSTNEET